MSALSWITYARTCHGQRAQYYVKDAYSKGAYGTRITKDQYDHALHRMRKIIAKDPGYQMKVITNLFESHHTMSSRDPRKPLLHVDLMSNFKKVYGVS